MPDKILTTRMDDAMSALREVQDIADRALDAVKKGDEDTCLELLETINEPLNHFSEYTQEFCDHAYKLLPIEMYKQKGDENGT